MPRQIRIDRCKQSLDSRVQKVASSLAKLIKAGLYTSAKLVREGDSLSPEGTPPLRFHPSAGGGRGGADKPGKPSEGRPLNDNSAPHGEAFERNHPHARRNMYDPVVNDVPDGPVVVSLNELTGPAKPPPHLAPTVTCACPDGCHGSSCALRLPHPDSVGEGTAYPWPSCEVKPRPRSSYQAAIPLSRIAKLLGSGVVSIDDDIRWMFFQFYIWKGEAWLSCSHMVFEIDGELWLCMLLEHVASMGTRPMSKFACRFALECLEA